MTEPTSATLAGTDYKPAAALARAHGDLRYAWAHLCDAIASLPDGHPAQDIVTSAVDALGEVDRRLCGITMAVEPH